MVATITTPTGGEYAEKEMKMKCYDRLSGERFVAADEDEIKKYLSEALCPGETVAYEVSTDSGDCFGGEITGGEA